MSNQPNYYAIIPANIRYSDKVNSTEKLLYAEITALCNQKGYCWASNDYFSKLFKKHPNSISRNIKNLSVNGFIKIHLVKEEKNVDKRRITLVGSQKCLDPLNKNVNTPLNKNVKHNTINSNNINEKKELFEKFWEAYNYKKSRKLCYDKFLKLSIDVCQKCVVSAKKYSQSITDIKYKKHPSTWLNQGCWDDEINENSNQGFTGNGFTNMVF